MHLTIFNVSLSARDAVVIAQPFHPQRPLNWKDDIENYMGTGEHNIIQNIVVTSCLGHFVAIDI